MSRRVNFVFWEVLRETRFFSINSAVHYIYFLLMEVKLTVHNDTLVSADKWGRK